MAQVNSVAGKRAATISTLKSKGQSLSRRERDQYRFIKRALRDPGKLAGSDRDSGSSSSLSDQQFILGCFTQTRHY